jgi:hypothetical protein
MDKKWTTIKVRLGAVRRFKEIFNVHPRESYNDIIERAIIDGELNPSDPNEDDEGTTSLLQTVEDYK